jgi:hypothetical protein
MYPYLQQVILIREILDEMVDEDSVVQPKALH